ncbi:hypothetical protein QZH41_011066 [Actinostola sp. cb2023]|nr:hypothetical protein QZH41_011066 [Actinostola sp. cb2023]
MAAEYVIFRSSNTFATFCANRSLSVSFCGHIRRASSLLRRDSVRDSQAHCRSMFRRSYCISTTIKAQKELQAVENIHSAVCVERLPFITPDKTDLKKRYEHLQDQFELEKSALSQDEVEVRKVKERKKKLTERDEDENLEIAQFEEQRKVFFYKACFVGGTVHLGAEYQDYVWVTRDEMKDFLKPDYYKNVSRFVR